MADPLSQVEAGIKQGLSDVFNNETLVALLDRRTEEELFEAGRRAVQLAVSPLIWSERLGPMLDTSQVYEQLAVTRQAVAKAVDAGRLLAIPAGKSRQFPAWQFTFGDGVTIRAEVAEVLAAFREVYPETGPLQIASWAMTAQPELEGATPASWLDEARPLKPVLLSARRAAAALSQ
jgi:hypothetical protein